MKSWGLKVGASLVLGSWSFVLSATAQYTIDWFKVADGGGTSTGSVYSVSGTTGQHDASDVMTNGQFSVTGGFWVLPQAVQTEGGPFLMITPAAPGFATISWMPNTPGFVLQETSILSPSNWTNSAPALTNGATLPALDMKFFRLKKE